MGQGRVRQALAVVALLAAACRGDDDWAAAVRRNLERPSKGGDEGDGGGRRDPAMAPADVRRQAQAARR